MPSQRDIVDKIQESHDIEESGIVQIAELLGYAGMFLFYMGLFQIFNDDPTIKMNGIFVFVLSVIIMALTTFGPTIATAYHVVGKKYVVNYVFYGDKMLRRDMECVRDPLVIARIGEEDVVEFLAEQDNDLRVIMDELGAEFLTDEQVAENINEAIKRRLDGEIKARKSKMGVFAQIKRKAHSIISALAFWRKGGDK